MEKQRIAALLEKYRDIILEVKLSPAYLEQKTGLNYNTCSHLCNIMLDEHMKEKYNHQINKIKDADRKIWEMIDEFHKMKDGYEKNKLGDRITREARIVSQMGIKELKRGYEQKAT